MYFIHRFYLCFLIIRSMFVCCARVRVYATIEIKMRWFYGCNQQAISIEFMDSIKLSTNHVMLNINHKHFPTQIVENRRKKHSFHQLTNLNAVHHVHGTKSKQMNAFRSLILFPQKTPMTMWCVQYINICVYIYILE